ncbi:hypothetical protein GLU64_00645 [Nanohaloarchaea archaeon]|nr:hypothetical protein [Candidatus Nanohaloarchaea archaeon]
MEDEHLKGKEISEKEVEELRSKRYDGWIELEDPENQMPKDRLDVEEYPDLKTVKEAQVPDNIPDEEIIRQGALGP